MSTLFVGGGGIQVLYYKMIGQVHFITLFLGFIYPLDNYKPINPSIFHLPRFPGRPPYQRHQMRRHIHHYYLCLCVLCCPIQNHISDLMQATLLAIEIPLTFHKYLVFYIMHVLLEMVPLHGTSSIIGMWYESSVLSCIIFLVLPPSSLFCRHIFKRTTKKYSV